jgi:hypothetical protein
VVVNDQTLVERLKALAPDGVDHIVEVAFGANVDVDVDLLKMGGTIGFRHRQRDAEDPILALGV